MAQAALTTNSTPAKDFLGGIDIEEARQSVETEGCFFIENAADPEFCRSAIDFIDHCEPDDETETQYAGTELRIYGAQKKNALLEEFFERCHQTMVRLFRKAERPKTLLAMRNMPVPQNDLSILKGRWHLDSFFDQKKIFLFLTDTNERCGPFEFIPRSHRKGFKLRMLCTGAYVRPSDLFGGRRAYQSIAESRIESLAQKGHHSKPVICRAGTLMVVNTSAIHRARPCFEGHRYLLMTYF